MSGDGLQREVIGLEGIAADGCADAVRTEQGVEAAESFVEAIRIADSGFEQLELLGFRWAGLGAEGKSNDRR